MKKEALEQMVLFLNSIDNGHIYSLEKMRSRLSEWEVLRKELEQTGAFNEKDGHFAIDAGMPVRYLRSVYQERLDAMEREEGLRHEARRHRLYERWFWALSILLSLTILIVSLIR